ncbi:MAG: galactose mutarotase [Dictyoglomaceae bacterium]|nr:galactose mutarotase [Dictyoglomaceae bacterium]
MKDIYIEKSFYGTTEEGIPVDQYTLINRNGLILRVITYGATITELWVPDRNGVLEDIVLGFDTLYEYESPNNPYLGCIVGRYANRIAKGRFVIDGIFYQLALNDGENSLHGGIKGFHRKVFKAIPMKLPLGPALRLKYFSHDGEEGYPGNLNVSVTYIFTNDNELTIEYIATTDKPTIINLTNHSYFNLSGEGSGNILEHELAILANNFTKVDNTLIPTGEILSVENTPLDFRSSRKIGERIKELMHPPFNGYDHNFVLNNQTGKLALCATVYDPKSGRGMDVYTTQPGVQLYTGNWLNIKGKGGKYYKEHYGFCLETQHYPDSPNHSNFPKVILRPQEIYRETTIYKFSIKI